MNWYTSDLHLSHINVISYCDRPYKNVHEMNQQLIKNWNSVVQEDDTVYVLGDVSMLGKSQMEKLKSFIKQLKGNKILIMGNHDEMNPAQYVKIGFNQVVYPFLETRSGWYAYHDPALATAIRNAELHLVGHVHQLFKLIPEKHMINVGVDVWDYYPVSEVTLETILKNWKFKEANNEIGKLQM